MYIPFHLLATTLDRVTLSVYYNPRFRSNQTFRINLGYVSSTVIVYQPVQTHRTNSVACGEAGYIQSQSVKIAISAVFIAVYTLYRVLEKQSYNLIHLVETCSSLLPA